MKNATRLLGKAIYANTLPPDLFDTDITEDRAKQLFGIYVDLVEIENHSYCNRTCWFCPNASIDRRTTNHLMKDELFEKILRDLESIRYSRTLVWSRYHEPLAHESIYARLATARQKLPDAYLVITSNGDYLNEKSIANLEATGLDRMLLDLYLPDHKEDDENELKESLRKFTNRTGLRVSETSHRNYEVTGSSIKITMGAPLYTLDNMSTRGGLMNIPKLHSYRRTASCFAPIHHVVVDFNGRGVLCCQARSDAAQHADSIIMDLNNAEASLFKLYRAMGPSRKFLVEPGAKGGICQSCDRSDDGPDRLSRNSIAAGTMRATGLAAVVQRVAGSRRGRRYDG